MVTANFVPQLGLVCITTSNAIRYRTITRKRLLSLPPGEQKPVLAHLYQENLNRLNAALDFCQQHNIRLYRIVSTPFPFADDPAGEDVLEQVRPAMTQIGQKARAMGIRLVMHPDQFVVLNSDSPQVVSNSIKILELHARILDFLEQPRSSWALIEIHGGKSGRAERLVEVIADLPDNIRQRLALENDEYAYSAAQVLEVCSDAGVPMVFDAHHHVCREQLSSYAHPSIARMVAAAQTTWPDPAWQVGHISNGRNGFTDRRHSDYVTDLPEAYCNLPWIEVEAKHKELAIEHLRQNWDCIARPDSSRLVLTDEGEGRLQGWG